MKIFVVMFHDTYVDTIVSIFSTEEAAKKCAEHSAGEMFPEEEFYWNGHFLFNATRSKEWSIQEWTVKE